VVAVFDGVEYLFDIPPSFVQIDDDARWNLVENIGEKGHYLTGFRAHVGYAPNHRNRMLATDAVVAEYAMINGVIFFIIQMTAYF